CFACHGPDSASRKAKLRLDRFEFATKARGEPLRDEGINRVA
ncbi:MAG: c-type cytochrome domain-containing protein, partial [Opitutaceae bacterium]